MFQHYDLIYTFGLIAASVTVLRSTVQPNPTALDRICDGTTLICLALLIVMTAKLIAPMAP
jgi:hypothetical protein